VPVADPSRVISIFGLHPDTGDRELRAHFSKFGEMDKICLITDRRTGLSKCFAFIYYKTFDDSVKAKEASTSLVLDGRAVRVDYSTTQRPHSPTPGQYMGRTSSPGHRSYSSSSGSYDRYEPRGGRRSPERSYRDDRDRRDDRGGDRGRDDRDRVYDRRDDRDNRSSDRGRDDRGRDDRGRDDRRDERYDRYDRDRR